MTITYNEISRKNIRDGVDITVEFTDGDSGAKKTKTFYFNEPSPSAPTITARMDNAVTHYEFDLNPLNGFGIEGVDDLHEIIKAMVVYIRNNPDCTFNDLTTAANTQYPDINWKIDKLVDRIREFADKDFTFAQFKTFVINKKFSGVDG